MKRWFGCALAVLLAATPVFAESEYTIGGGDALQINVWKNAELSNSVIVRPDGQITLPLIGDVKAEGLTPMQLGKVLAARIASFVNAPNVTVTVSAPTNYRVYTQGAIANGVHSLSTPISARQLLARAGGPGADADLARAYILRGEERIPVDLTTPSPEQPADGINSILVPGDILAVPSRFIKFGQVFVAGEVARPNALPFVEGMRFLDAYLGAGGGTASADLKNARIARRLQNGEILELPVNLDLVLKQGALNLNIALAAGDIVVVPFRQPLERVLIVGEVTSPRSLDFREGLTLLDAFVEAGGGTDYADLDSVKVVRQLPDGKKQELRADLERLLKKADLTGNLPLSPGDIVLVPR